VAVRKGILRSIAGAGALLLLATPGALAAKSPPVSDDGSRAPAPSAEGPAAPQNLPQRADNMEVVGRFQVPGVRPGQIADVSVHKGYAYLNSWDDPNCAGGGTYVVDIRDPSRPQQVSFIPALPDFYHGEGAHAVSIDTPAFKGDILAVNDETYGSNLVLESDCLSDGAGFTGGGFDLYDVTDPANPKPLVQGAGDNEPADENPAANSYHSVFVWQDGPRAYLVASDNVELTDVDIFDITDPRNPVQVGDHDLAARFPQILAGEAGNGGTVLHHDMVVKHIDGRPVLMSDYWDAGYVQMDVSDPANPRLLVDTTFAGEDPLLPGTGITPEGNAHQGEFSFDNQFLLAADEDFAPFRSTTEVLTGAGAGEYPSAEPGDTAAPIFYELSDSILDGPTTFVGDACDPATIPDPPVNDPATDAIALVERGGTLPNGDACGFAAKIANVAAAGWEGYVVFNQERPDDTLVNMLTGGAQIPGVHMRRVDALAGLFGGATETPAIGTAGEGFQVTVSFDGWGYAHLYDAKTGQHLDAFAIPEALDSRFGRGFGDLSIHEFATDPETNLAYSSYYAGGVRVFRYSRLDGLEQTGAWIDGGGSNFWGIEQFTAADGSRLIAGSDRDYGLVILRYTGPGAVGPKAAGGGPATTTPTARPSNRIRRVKLGRYKNGRVRLDVTVPGPGLINASMRANVRGKRASAAVVRRLARTTRNARKAGTYRVVLRLSKAKQRQMRRTLKARKRVRATIRIAFEPTGGVVGRTSRKLTIRR
jgi:hypothetical protein